MPPRVKARKPGAAPVREQGGTPKELFGIVPPIPQKPSFISRCCGIIVQDINEKLFRAKALTEDPPPGWEHYKRFLELSGYKGNGGKKKEGKV